MLIIYPGTKYTNCITDYFKSIPLFRYDRID